MVVGYRLQVLSVPVSVVCFWGSVNVLWVAECYRGYRTERLRAIPTSKRVGTTDDAEDSTRGL